jgi:hypothetical protein
MQKVAFVASMLIASSEAVGTMERDEAGVMTGFVKSDITCDRKSPIKFGDKVKKACGSYDPKEKC